MEKVATQESCIASCLNNSFRRHLSDKEHDDYINRYFYESTEHDESDSDIDEEIEEKGDEVTDDDGDYPIVVVPFARSRSPSPGKENVDPQPLCEDTVSFDPILERRKVEAMRCTCKKSFPPSTKIGCWQQFSVDEILHSRWTFAEHSSEVQDAFILGSLLSLPCNTGELTCSTKQVQVDRKRTRTKNFFFMNRVVCRKMFTILLGINGTRLSNLQKTARSSPLEMSKKRRGGRNRKSVSVEDTTDIINFLKNLVEEEGISLPGRVPGFHRTDIQLLPTHYTKASIHRLYLGVCRMKDLREVGITAFKTVWKAHLPNIVVGRPKTDLCWTCQQNNTKIFRSANTQDDVKQELLLTQEMHLAKAREERNFYKSCATMAEAAINRVSAGLSTELEYLHYSFDFAQQVHLPHNPLQPGPMYFLCPRKVGIFGVCCEAVPQQTNYLIDEGMSSSKGSNMVISLLHHHFASQEANPKAISLHCDNCSGQNKNRFMLFYLAWRVFVGLNTEMELHFMPAGHTKFAPDWCFGLLKRRFRVTQVNSLKELCDVVNNSTEKGINKPAVVGWEDGRSEIPIYNWQTFFQKGKPLVGIKTLSHFKFECNSPGVVFYKANLDDDWKQFALFSAAAMNMLPPLPVITPPPGLSRERAEYLHKQIRPFVLDSAQDILCPQPS